jgi:hypothetical protein
MAWSESGLFYATWRDTLKQAVAMSLLDTNNNISLSSSSDTPDYASVTDPSTWTNANEVTGGAPWPTGGINLAAGTYAPALSKVSGPPVLLKWSMQPLSVPGVTTTAPAYGAYIYANGLTPKAKIIGIWFGGTGYPAVNGTFAITWNAAGILTLQMAA